MAGKRTGMAAHLSVGELRERVGVRKGVDARETRRWQALWLFGQGQSARQVNAATGLSVSWLAEIKRRYNAEGITSVADGHRRRPGGARSLLSEAQRLELAAAIEAPVPARLGGGLWSGRKVALWVKTATGRAIRPQQGCVSLRALGFGLRVPRPRHRKAASPQEQAAFKKSSPIRWRKSKPPTRKPAWRSGRRTRRAWASSPSCAGCGRAGAVVIDRFAPGTIATSGGTSTGSFIPPVDAPSGGF